MTLPYRLLLRTLLLLARAPRLPVRRAQAPAQRLAAALLARGALGAACACSSAQLDPNSRALTLYTPSPSTSVAPTANGSPTATPSQKVSRSNSENAAPVSSAAEPRAAAMLARAGQRSVVCSSLPDPAPARTDRWIALTVRLDKGVLGIASSTQHRSRRLETTKRAMGRFAAELWIGCELIDRVRFDFPLLAAEPNTGGAHDPSFEASSHFETTVFVPDSDRATRIELVDRAHETHRLFDWPLRVKN